MSQEDTFNQRPQRDHVPLISLQCFLEDLVEEDTECLRFLQLGESFDAILENSTTLTINRIRHHCGGYKMIGVKDNHMVGVIHNTAAGGVVVSDQMKI